MFSTYTPKIHIEYRNAQYAPTNDKLTPPIIKGIKMPKIPTT